jgi:hypothetical protein
MSNELAAGEIKRLADFLTGLNALSRHHDIWLAEYEPLHVRVTVEYPEDDREVHKYQVVRVNREPHPAQPGFHYTLDLTGN